MRRTEQDMIAEIERYSGKIFPRTSMLIHGFAGRNERNQVLVECSSESRGKFIAIWNEVKRGKVKGTVKGESHIRRNSYIIQNDIIKVFFGCKSYFICDIQDIEVVKSRTWYLNSNGYARSSNGEYFHRIITNVPNDYIVDHINRDKLDNRQCNLRICKPIDNSHNMSMFSTNNSGHTGVYKNKSGKYSATIIADYKVIRLGTFDTFEGACAAYDGAKAKYHTIEEVMGNNGLAETNREC